MTTVKVNGLDDLRQTLVELGNMADTVHKYAQNNLAYTVYVAEKDQMASDIDRPNPWSLGSLRYKKYDEPGGPGAPAVKGAAVHFYNETGASFGLEPEEYLGVQQLGGQTAGPRRSEKALQMYGIISRDVVWVPAVTAPLDAYGNVKGSMISAMLTDLGTNPYATTVDKTYALIGPVGDPVGVFTKASGKWVPFIWFVPRAQYMAIYDFDWRADHELALHLLPTYEKYTQIALDKLK